MIAVAEERLAKYDNLILLHGDGFAFDGSFDVFVSNLPYAKSRKAIEWLATRRFDRAVVMVQKEFARKILANHGSNYRAISALAQHCFHTDIIMHVGKESFNPQPKVDSVLLKIVQKDKVSNDVVKALKLLFSYRGKKVTSVVKKFRIRSINVEKRIEQLTPSEAVGLARIIVQKQRLLQTVR
jgi:16S rRNA (adenine1518-N6/adenine1519-N6)-dimethyltransferase